MTTAFDPHALMAREFAPIVHRYDTRDTMLYALSVGMGADPLSADQLRFVYERDLQALPTMVSLLAYPGFWADDPTTGIDWRRLVHVEQAYVLHTPVPVAACVVGRNRVSAIYDKGAAKGALMVQSREIVDADTGGAIGTVTQTTMLRGNGGCGGSEGVPAAPHALPDRAPDATCDLPIALGAALLYRLNGDFNPLHVDIDIARQAGFEKPILHGMCTLGVATHAIVATMLGFDASAVRGMRVRFSAPVYPGETLRTEMWRAGNVLSFRCSIPAREVVVLTAGRVDLA